MKDKGKNKSIKELTKSSKRIFMIAGAVIVLLFSVAMIYFQYNPITTPESEDVIYNHSLNSVRVIFNGKEMNGITSVTNFNRTIENMEGFGANIKFRDYFLKDVNSIIKEIPAVSNISVRFRELSDTATIIISYKNGYEENPKSVMNRTVNQMVDIISKKWYSKTVELVWVGKYLIGE